MICLEDAYNWQGIHFSRQNFCNWQQKIFDATEPLRKLYYGELNRGKYLQFDETPIEIQKQDKEAILAEYWEIQGTGKRKMMTAKMRKMLNRKPERTATCGWFSAVNTRFALTISDGLEAERMCFHSLKTLRQRNPVRRIFRI